ncbi:hypothetical protein R1sor_004351 [Riccia sorocarpa]|uniref:Uncharacterized protein n=1 Tax=Riccia sorocarpa TaxID=122646 RepID=A0ABD3HK77_9MARC
MESQIDLSRLDRVYLMKGAEWVHHIKHLEHHHARRGSNHVPVSMTAVLNMTQPRRDSYFKMDVHALYDLEVRRKVQEAWANEPDIVRDDRRRWARGWCRVKTILRSVRDLRELERKEEDPLEEEMTWGENIEALEGEEEEVITDRDEILEEIHDFYQTLYKTEQESPEAVAAREEVMGLIQNHLTPDESLKISAIPDLKEVESVVFGMKSNKAPRFDGLTVEII